MRIAIHLDICSGHGRCYALCPEVFGEDEDGYPVLASETVPEPQREAARAAEQNCPERAIEITE
jgi:ferredoxin